MAGSKFPFSGNSRKTSFEDLQRLPMKKAYFVLAIFYYWKSLIINQLDKNMMPAVRYDADRKI